MIDCIAKQFGCSCVGECQSAARPIMEIQKRHEAKRRADKAMGIFALALTVGVFVATFVFVTIPKSHQMAKAEQEKVANVYRP